MKSSLPTFLRPETGKKKQYERVQPRIIEVPSPRALRNLSRLTVADGAHGVHPQILAEMMMRVTSGESIVSRLEPKSTPGKFRELWIPQDETYAYVLSRLSNILGTFRTSPEALAFRKGLNPMQGLRGMIDEYEVSCRLGNIPKKKNKSSEGYVVGTAYQADIENYFGNVTYEQVLEFLRDRFVLLLNPVLSADEILELADLVADIVCPGEVLPQGFATSPAIANGVGVKLDVGIRQGVRAVLGNEQVSVSARYADDLIVMASGGFNERVLAVMADVLGQHGFKMHPKKVHITRALEADRASAIKILGTHIRNDGDGPLSFTPTASYVNQVAEAMRYVLDGQFDEEDLRNHVRRIHGATTHIANILKWGRPYGERLRKGQKTVLPKDLERLWDALRKKLGDALTPRQKSSFDLSQSDFTAIDKGSKVKDLGALLTDALEKKTGWQVVIMEDQRRLTVHDETGDLIFEISPSVLKSEIQVEDMEELESYLLEVEEELTEAASALEDKFEEAEINSPDDLSNHPELKKAFYLHYLQFVKWYLSVNLNLLDLSEEQRELLYDTTAINATAFNSDELILPWGIGTVFEDFQEKFGRFVSKKMGAILTNPYQMHKAELDGYKFTPEGRSPKTRRDARGSFWRFPALDDLSTYGGKAIEAAKQPRKLRKKLEDRSPEEASAVIFDGAAFSRISS